MRHHHIPHAALYASLALAGVGCGAADTGDLTGNPAPKLMSTPQTVVFGQVPAGAIVFQPVVLSNTGNAPTGPIARGPQSSLDCSTLLLSQPFCLDVSATTLAPGESTEAVVIYYPRAETVPQETSWQVTCGPGCETMVFSRGSAVAEPVRAPAMIDFGRAHPSCSLTQTLTVTSEVDIDVDLETIEIEADAPDIYAVQANLPQTLEARGTLTLPLRFDSRVGDLPGVLRLGLRTPGLGLNEGLSIETRTDLIGRGDEQDPPCP